ncbi:MAG TPA: zinc ribbon domain-containing protein [Methylomusa anaerophila]|uniref:Double zinc ribbon n=1 Tax=Methylomusa anaerophila TaxID=1930071 RepID=A0A348AG27_9FIRM|nr:zinc ribbon domain-containing protein [Methylomusa anaerophila]BBB90025.1 double zinc ribbon [Methylomusa anaerophila]HML88246.1 zinc ribbon domain-containing protein [Methylomusa anaerophila]
MFSLHVIIGLLAAFWVYTDARKLGQELGTAILWAIGVAGAIYIFLPLYLIFGRKPSLKPRRVDRDREIIDVEAIPVDETINCPMCGGKVKDDFKVCPYCGHTLQPKCPSCGRELNREWRTCPHCQTPTEAK